MKNAKSTEAPRPIASEWSAIRKQFLSQDAMARPPEFQMIQVP